MLRIFRLVRVHRLLDRYGARNVVRCLLKDCRQRAVDPAADGHSGARVRQPGHAARRAGRRRRRDRHRLRRVVVRGGHDFHGWLRRSRPGDLRGRSSVPASSSSAWASSARSPAIWPTCSSPPASSGRGRTRRRAASRGSAASTGDTAAGDDRRSRAHPARQLTGTTVPIQSSNLRRHSSALMLCRDSGGVPAEATVRQVR